MYSLQNNTNLTLSYFKVVYKMKNILLFLQLALILDGCSYSSTKEEKAKSSTNIKCATFNIRYDNPEDGKNSWKYRKDSICNFIKAFGVEIVGMQEVLYNQMEDLKCRLPEFASIGVGRDDGKMLGEYAPIFYNTVRFEVIDSNTFWLSQDPERVGFIGWDGACTRIATWAKFRDRKTNTLFLFINTHFDHVGTEARRNGALLIIKQIKNIADYLPVILTGDFNVSYQSEAYKTLTTNDYVLKDAHKVAKEAKGPIYTFHDFGRLSEEKREKIDFIFVSSPIEVLKSEIVQESKELAEYLSDHNPQIIDIEM